MSKAGQNTFSGISAQADVALLHLLENYTSTKFEEIIIEGSDWEDFTLKSEDKTESFEVKWYGKPLSYADLHSIIKKEVKKGKTEDYKFKIVARSFSPKLLDDVNYLKQSLPYWGFFNKERKIEDNPIIKKFLGKKWTDKEIVFLLGVELRSIGSDDLLTKSIYEHFTFKNQIYLNQQDVEGLAAIAFNTIMKKGAEGGSITKTQFIECIESFEKNLAEKSEAFTPEISIGKKVENINQYLKNKNVFQQLNHPKYLTPLTYKKNNRLVFYIVEMVGDKKFDVSDVSFFLEKVLIKQSFIFSCFKFLEDKWKQDRLSPEYFLWFLNEYYDQLEFDYTVHDALEMILEIVRKKPDLSSTVLSFLRAKIFPNTKSKNPHGSRNNVDFGYKYQHLAPIVIEIGKSIEQKEKLVDILFENFDFTGDSHRHVIETPSEFYRLVKDYIEEDIEKNWNKTITKITKQFVGYYGKIYSGYELVGSGVEVHGHSFDITDVGLVRKLFYPLLLEIQEESPEKVWKVLTEKVLVFGKAEATRHYPIFLKRAAIPILLDLIENKDVAKKIKIESSKQLIKILQLKKGLPGTSEITFKHLSNRDLKVVGYDFALNLLKIDSEKFGQNKFPTNIFALRMLTKLIEDNYGPALEVLLNLATNKDFLKTHLFVEYLSLLGDQVVLKNSPQIRFQFLKAMNIKLFLDGRDDDRWISADFVKNLLVDLWRSEPERGDEFLKYLIQDEKPSEGVLRTLSNALFGLTEEFGERILSVLAPYAVNEQIFKNKFGNGPYFRETYLRLAESSLQNKDYAPAKQLIELCLVDPDPNTDEISNYNYHEKIKGGEKANVISGVRAQAAWALQKLVLQNDAELMAYSLSRIRKLLDLDGSLARQLGYRETDLYIMSQAMVPLIEIVHPARRKLLNEFKAGLGDEAKDLAFQLLNFIAEQFKKGLSKPEELAEKIVHVFSFIRDLNTSEATTLLDFFEWREVDEAAFLFIYFAVFHSKNYPDISFDPKSFEKRLERLCTTKNPIRQSMSWHIWKILTEEKVKASEWSKIEHYWLLLLKEYDSRVFTYFSMTLEVTLKKPPLYTRHLAILKDAIKTEILALKKSRDYPKISLRKIAPVLLEKNPSDFYDILDLVLSESDPLTGEGVFGIGLSELIQQFKKIEDVPEAFRTRHESLKEKLDEIGALS